MATEAEQQITMKKRLEDIYLDISWRELSRHYFDKSVSWLYNKLNGRDGNGGRGDFTKEEALKLKSALIDLSERIRRCADTIDA